VAILAIVAGGCYETLGQRPAQARATAVAFAALVADARALAAVTGDASGGTGATIAITREGEFSVARLYANRPIRGVSASPTRALNTPPLRTTTKLAMLEKNGPVEPPFALFFSASGHLSAYAPFVVGSDPGLAAEPDCPLATGVIIAFIDGVHNGAHALSCELARLDLDTTLPVRLH
jgi:hypothetical protein